jgi:Protein of unknown function DUF262/Protein of unknown function (DUF1524)
MTVPLAETPTVGLGQFIKEARFTVPSHQRDYSWKQEYIDQFVADITRSMNEKESIYFCGLMVFVQSEATSTTFRVLDGQQRLATTIMLLGAIRNWLGRYSEFAQLKQQIDEHFLGEVALGETEISPKLVLNSANNDLFRKIVISSVPIADVRSKLKGLRKSDRNRALLEAVLFLHNKTDDIAKKCVDPGAARTYFVDLIKFITQTVRIVRLIVTGDDAAYTIFEVLNDRGMELAPLDLVKNYLFSKVERSAPHQLREMEDRWTEMMTIISDKKADSFFRAFWTSRHGVPEGARLFAPFKRSYDTTEKAYQASISLREAAEHFRAVSDHNDPVWASHTEKSREFVRGISIVGSTQFYPLIMAALALPNTFDSDEMERLLKLIEVLAVRHSLIRRGRPGRIESLGGITARQVSEGAINSTRQVFDRMKELYTDDDQFKSDFISIDSMEAKKVNFLLRRLERQAQLQKNNIHWREVVADAVTVEHILPKSPSDDWRDTLEKFPDFKNRCVGKLGNLCLLSDANKALANRGFAEKKAVYATSKQELTSSISSYNEWTPDEVENRQLRLANLAVAAWRFD